MTKSLLPVSDSTSTPSHFIPSVAKWGVREVVILLGVSAIGLLIYALYRRSRPDHDSDSTPFTTPRLRDPALDSPRTTVDSTDIIDLNSQFSLDEQHSSKMLHNGQPCLNETIDLPFNHFAEGHIVISLANFFRVGKIILPPAVVTVRCIFHGAEFYSYKGKVDAESIFEFFMPNIPFQEVIILQIETDDQSKTEVSFIATKASCLYRIDHHRSSWCNTFPEQREIRRCILSSPISIESPFEITFSKEDQQVVVEPQAPSESITIKNHNDRAVIYLKIVNEAISFSSHVALALPFHLSPLQLRTISPSDLIELWKFTFTRATGKQAPSNLNLKLYEIQVITYK